RLLLSPSRGADTVRTRAWRHGAGRSASGPGRRAHEPHVRGHPRDPRGVRDRGEPDRAARPAAGRARALRDRGRAESEWSVRPGANAPDAPRPDARGDSGAQVMTG